MDIVTDISTASHFFRRGDFNWGMCTTLPIFAPFIVRIIVWISQLKEFIAINPYLKGEGRWSIPKVTIEIKKTQIKIHLRKLPSQCWHFPALLPMR